MFRALRQLRSQMNSSVVFRVMHRLLFVQGTNVMQLPTGRPGSERKNTADKERKREGKGTSSYPWDDALRGVFTECVCIYIYVGWGIPHTSDP